MTKIAPFLIAFVMACGSQKTNSELEEVGGLIPTSWIQSRVGKAQLRLNETPEGKQVWDAIEAHGGLEKWFSNGVLRFHFDYKPLNGSIRRNSYQTVNQWSVQSVHELASNREVKFGWDGEHAWSYPDTAILPLNPRFWSNTPFYFLGLPFVLADEGIVFHSMKQDSLDGQVYDLVKVTYEKETGDAPDDFYVIYLDPSTHQLVALRYIVTYPGFFPDGGHSPEKIMKLKALQKVDSIYLSTGYKTYWWTGGVGEWITDIDVSEVSFDDELSNDFFVMPKGAKIQKEF